MKKFNAVYFTGIIILCFGSGISPANASLLQLSHDPLFLNQTVPPAIAVTLDDSGSMAEGYMGNGSGNNFATPTENRLYYNPNITYTPPVKADGSQMPNSSPKAAWVDGYSNNMNATIDLNTKYVPIASYTYDRYDADVHITFKRTGAPNVNQNYIDDYSYNSYHPNWSAGSRAFYLTKSSGTFYITYLTDTDDLQNFANWYSYYNSRMKLARASISRAFAGFGPSFKIDWQRLHKDTTLDNLSKFETSHRDDFYDWLFESPTNGGTPLRNAFKRTGDLFEKDSSYKSDDYNTTLSCQQNFHIAVSDGAWKAGFSIPSSGLLRDENTYPHLPGDTGTDKDANPKYGAYNGTGEQRIYKYKNSEQTGYQVAEVNLADIAFHYWASDLRPDMNNNVKRFKKDFTDSSGKNITVPPGGDEWDVPAFVWNPKNNPAYWQHIVTYNVGLGLDSTLVVAKANGLDPCGDSTNADPKSAIYEDLRDGGCTWPWEGPESYEYNQKVDDVWHASVNSRGGFFSANDPNELVKALNDVVNDILERLSRGSTSTVSSGVITNDALAFSPGFDSSKWSGNLLAREVDKNGTFGNPLWDASCVLTGGNCSATGEIVTKQLNRNIYTYNKALTAKAVSGLVPFDTGLSVGLKAVLGYNGQDVLNRTGASVNDLIDYITGEQGKEISQGGYLRNRTSVLADIVHSSPSVVKGPAEAYNDSSWPQFSNEAVAADKGNGYLDFQVAQKDRHNVLYVGSNDGMLHAFDAESTTTTTEYWGYIPSKAFNNLHRLIDPQFKHWSFVDNTPVVRDAFFNDKWHTTLVGGMRYGGQAFYALDVTKAPTTKSSQPDVMWEFTDEDDADMGYSYGEANIVRIGSTGEWVALIPNGYNNSAKDFPDPTDPRNHISQTGHAVLFVVRLSDGELLAKLDTGEGSTETPNGLATAISVDSEFSNKTNSIEVGVDLGADFAYAGDLYGNLWRFDFSSKNYSDWEASSNIKRIVKADNIMNRPITTQPRAIPLPNNVQTKENDVIVLYGTGKYIEVPDRSINLPDDQYMVGVVDGLDSSDGDIDVDSSAFVEQTFSTNNEVRTLSDKDVNLILQSGWKVKLTEKGERLANPLSLLGSQLLLASTTVTAGIDPCEGGGRSWLTAFNPYTGGTSKLGEIFSGDIIVGVDPDGDPITAISDGDSKLINDLIIGRPPLLEVPGSLQLIVEGSEGTEIIPLQSYTWRRRNWTNLLTE